MVSWAILVGIGVLCVWFTVGGLRSHGNCVPLWMIRAKTGGEPYGDTRSRQSLLVLSWGVDV